MQIKRAPDQTLIAFACHVELLRAVDIARALSGDDRSSFIRKAVYAELVRRKQPVEEAWIKPPDRAKKARYPEAPPAHAPAAQSNGTTKPAAKPAKPGKADKTDKADKAVKPAKAAKPAGRPRKA